MCLSHMALLSTGQWLMSTWYRAGTGRKTQINYFYLLNETTLILGSRSGRKQADLLTSSNVVGISLITRGTEGLFSAYRKLIVLPNHLSQPWSAVMMGRGVRWENTRADWQLALDTAWAKNSLEEGSQDYKRLNWEYFLNSKEAGGL